MFKQQMKGVAAATLHPAIASIQTKKRFNETATILYGIAILMN